MLRTTILITLGLLIIGIINGCGDNPPEEVTDPRQSEDNVGPPSATEVVVDPLPRASTDAVTYLIPRNTKFTLTFNEGVIAVTVNDMPALGSGLVWKWSARPALPYGPIKLQIEWTNRDGSKGFSAVGPYRAADVNIFPPEIASGTVSDGAADVDPAPINAGGFRFDFDEHITGNIVLTDEAGANLDWIANVAGQTATLTAVAGRELVNETTYKIEIDVQDGVGNPLRVTITFVTKPK